MDDLPLLGGLLLAVLSTDAQSLSLGHPHLARFVEVTSGSLPAATMRSQKKTNKKKKKPPPPTWGQQYKDPGGPGSLGGLHRFARTHRQRVQRLRPHLEKELAYTLHKPVRRRFPTLRVQVWGMDHQWVADLAEVQRLAKHNGGTRYLLTVLDVLSKYAWVEPLKDKTGRSLAQAWERLLQRAHPRRPRQLQTDQGKEFYNCPFQQVLKKHAIHHFSTYGDTKASVIERFNRTLKERLYRYLTAANTLKFVDVLPQVVQGYNASWHRRHRAGAPRRHTPQRIGGVAPLVSPTLVTPPLTQVEGGRPGPFEQRGAPLSQRLLTRVDRRSVCGPPGGARQRAHLQSGRIRRHLSSRHLLRTQTATGDGGRRHLVAHRKST